MTPAQIATLAEYGLRPQSDDERIEHQRVLMLRRPCRCGRTRRPR